MPSSPWEPEYATDQIPERGLYKGLYNIGLAFRVQGLNSKLPKGGCIGIKKGSTIGAIKGDTRSLDSV